MKHRLPLEKLDLYPLVAALGIGCGVTVLLITVFNYFVPSMRAELGLSGAAVSGVLSLNLAAQIIGFPLVGQLADRYGPRWVILTCALFYAGSFLWLSRIGGSRGALYLVAFCGGFLGSGAGPVCYSREIVRRMDRHRGLGLGIALAGGGLAGIVLPRLIRPIVLAHGWRMGFVVLSALAAGAGILGALCSSAQSRRPESAADHVGLASALRTNTFWKMTVAFALLALAMSAIVSHLTEIWTSLGFDSKGVPDFQAVMGLATIGGRLIGGAAMDRMAAKFVGASAACAGAFGLVQLAWGASSDSQLRWAAVFLGLCLGAESDVVSYLSSHYFGVRRFARVYSALGAFFLLGFALGPVSFSILEDRFGTRRLLGCAATVLAFSAVVILTLRAPRSEGGEAQSTGGDVAMTEARAP